MMTNPILVIGIFKNGIPVHVLQSTHPNITALSIQYPNHDFFILSVVNKSGHAETVKWLRRFNLTTGHHYKKKFKAPLLIPLCPNPSALVNGFVDFLNINGTNTVLLHTSSNTMLLNKQSEDF